MNQPFHQSPFEVDALLPVDMAMKSEAIGEKKAKLNFASTFVLAVLAGAFIGFGGLLYTIVVTTGEVETAFGFKKLLGGIAFSLGLVLVIVGGAELFTGNNLIVMAWASRRISTLQVLRNWLIVYLGNFVGALSIALLAYFSGVSEQHDGSVAETMRSIASHKCNLEWGQAFASGVGCNVLVCLAVWLCMSARTVADKILSIIFPITAFVAIGLEHCVANMYFVPVAMLIGPPQSVSDSPATKLVAEFGLHSFLVNNLVPVTLGNIFGGAVLVGLVYWFVYLRKSLADR